jgi:adenylyl-sulfate kinase
MSSDSAIIWLTGMSGSGKSTLANLLMRRIEKNGRKVLIIDGDSVRDGDDQKLGFGIGDVRINNTRIASICSNQRNEFDVVIVPVISPYEEVRIEIRTILEPNFHLVYLQADIESLKHRDTKGLYSAADRGDINDLIGYSEINPYDEPNSPELVISTANKVSLEESFSTLFDYVNKAIFNRQLSNIVYG